MKPEQTVMRAPPYRDPREPNVSMSLDAYERTQRAMAGMEPRKIDWNTVGLIASVILSGVIVAVIVRVLWKMVG